MANRIEVARVFNAPIEAVWALWTDPDLVRSWWGPDRFTCPVARIDLREGGTSFVSMKAAAEMGGREFYTHWKYVRIVHMQSIEFIQSLVDESGDRADPAAFGMPADFPPEIRTRVTFRDAGDGRTEMTVTEQAEFGSISDFARIGLEQSVGKMVI